jgi:hypothetical protein
MTPVPGHISYILAEQREKIAPGRAFPAATWQGQTPARINLVKPRRKPATGTTPAQKPPTVLLIKLGEKVNI